MVKHPAATAPAFGVPARPPPVAMRGSLRTARCAGAPEIAAIAPEAGSWRPQILNRQAAKTPSAQCAENHEVHRANARGVGGVAFRVEWRASTTGTTDRAGPRLHSVPPCGEWVPADEGVSRPKMELERTRDAPYPKGELDHSRTRIARPVYRCPQSPVASRERCGHRAAKREPPIPHEFSGAFLDHGPH